MPVSESEKRRVSSSGCHFIEKVEHLPIKKRRFVLRSPSPPPSELPHPIIPSPPVEETADLTNGQNASVEPEALESTSSDMKTSQIADNNISVNDNKSEKANERFGKGGDFSGISILAAVACGSSLGSHSGYVEDDGLCVEESLTQEPGEVRTDTEVCSSSKGLLKEYLVDSSETYTGGNSSCIATEPAGELAPMVTPVSSSQTFSEEACCNKDEEREGNPRHLFRNDRFHWDLNVVMDAWEHPLDYPEAKSDVPYTSQNGGKIKDDDNTKSLDGPDSACGDQVSPLPDEPRALSNQSFEGTQENHDRGACHNAAQTSGLGEKSLLSDCNNNMGVVKSVVKETEWVHNDEPVKATDGSVITVSDHVTRRPASGSMNEGESDIVKSLTLNEDSHLTYRPIVEGVNSTATVSSPVLENHRSASEPDATFSNMQITPCVSSTSDIQGEIVPNLASLDNLEKPDLPCHENAALEKVHLNSQYEDGEVRETQERLLQHYDVDGEVEQVDYGSDINTCSIVSADYYATKSGQVEDTRAVAISSDVCNIGNEVCGITGKANGEVVIPDEDNKLRSSHQTEEKTNASRSRRLLCNVANGVEDDNGLVAETRVESRVFRRGLQSWIDVPSREERLHRYDEFGSTRSSGRGGRYNGPTRDESFQSSLKYRRPLSRRERSLSPFEGRGHSNAPPHHSRGKYASQSRSRSPVMWNSPNRRPVPGSGTLFRQRSRSPNFRPEGRMQRLRSPHHHQQRGFRPDHGAGGFRSFPRANGSPPPRSRWNSSSRKDEQGHFREFDGYKPRGSAIMDRSPPPGRMRNIRGGGDRANDVMGGSPRNVKPDGYYRIPEENYEDHQRKQHYGGPPLHRPPARRSYENDGNFSVGNNFIRDRDGGPSFRGRGGGGLRGNMDNRIGDLPRRFRGGDQHHQQQQSFRYEHGDGKFGSNNSKQFSVEGTKSEENYRSSAHNTGRFTENYEDRRKHFEKRLSNHNNVDENFEDGSDFQNRGGMRSFAGRIGTSLSNRLIREEDHQDPVVCAQNEEKFDGNLESVGTLQNSEDKQ